MSARYGRASAGAVLAASIACVAMFALALSSSRLHRGTATLAAVVFTAVVVALVIVLMASWRQRVHDQATAEQLQRQFVATAATSGGWVYVIDPGGRFVYSSDASREFLGYHPRAAGPGGTVAPESAGRPAHRLAGR